MSRRLVLALAAFVVVSCVASLATADPRATIVNYSKQAASGAAIPKWKGGAIPYSWGGGHGAQPGPSYGTCAGYTGPIKPCPATKTFGSDCSGFSRWMYSLGFGSDRLGAGTAAMQFQKGTKVSNPVPGDLVFFSSGGHIVHVGVYIGNDQMVNAPHTGAFVRVDRISGRTVAGYARYN